MGVVFALFYVRFKRVLPLVVAHTILDMVSFVGYALLKDQLTFCAELSYVDSHQWSRDRYIDRSLFSRWCTMQIGSTPQRGHPRPTATARRLSTCGSFPKTGFRAEAPGQNRDRHGGDHAMTVASTTYAEAGPTRTRPARRLYIVQFDDRPVGRLHGRRERDRGDQAREPARRSTRNPGTTTRTANTCRTGAADMLKQANINGKSRRSSTTTSSTASLSTDRPEVLKLRAHHRACGTSGRTRSSSRRPPTPRSSSAWTGERRLGEAVPG